MFSGPQHEQNTVNHGYDNTPTRTQICIFVILENSQIFTQHQTFWNGSRSKIKHDLIFTVLSNLPAHTSVCLLSCPLSTWTASLLASWFWPDCCAFFFFLFLFSFSKARSAEFTLKWEHVYRQTLPATGAARSRRPIKIRRVRRGYAHKGLRRSKCSPTRFKKYRREGKKSVWVYMGDFFLLATNCRVEGRSLL